MEYVQGASPHTWAGRNNPTARRVAEVVRALGRQLAAVHRDVKCANVVVREKDGRPVLVDFGVGTFPGAHPVTGPRVPGTAPYRSPEAKGHRHEQGRYEAHAHDDLWALGVVLYLDHWNDIKYPLPKGTVFSGELFVGPERVYGRFTQARTPEGHTYPMCLELYEQYEYGARGVLRREPGGTANTAIISTKSTRVLLRAVPRFDPVPERE
ncbi:hypothetical protein Q664_50300 [Archangium violaceum Cb vi76]|uniref:Protein kinase domain-containing protein n=2 Tax=Archangium violaceum TaxID=83451 RepID=A0A084SF43_9BACT|nr:hypothetical protein Q664_50300 [Archangium violaceum Cb vi76]